MKKHYLYRHFSDAGALLYIGITNDLKRRRQQHCDESPWFHEINKIEHVSFDSREQALEAERAAIRDERPIYNVEARALSERYSANRKRAERERKNALGLVRTEIWIRPELLADVHAYVRRISSDEKTQ